MITGWFARILNDEDDMQVLDELASGEDAVEFVKHHAPDVVLLDARMPGMGGIEATHSLIKISPHIRIIVMSSITKGIIPSQMLRAGARALSPRVSGWRSC